MTVREILTMADGIRPNAYEDREKIYWLNTIEGRIYKEILNVRDGYDDTFIPFEEGEEERELAIKVPYTDIYLYYLAAMIDIANGDSNRYNDTMVLFNTAWDDVAAYYRREYKPRVQKLKGMLARR